MKIAMSALVMALGSASVFAGECPDFSGQYGVDGLDSCVVTVKQTGCRLSEFQVECKNPPFAVSDTLISDGVFRADAIPNPNPSPEAQQTRVSTTAHRMTSNSLITTTISAQVSATKELVQTSMVSESTLETNGDMKTVSSSYDSSGKLTGLPTVQIMKRIK